MKVKPGREHTLLGIDISILRNGKIKLFMKDYLLERINVFEEVDGKLNKKANAPAKGNVFNVDGKSNPLDTERTELFHHIVSSYCMFQGEQGYISN